MNTVSLTLRGLTVVQAKRIARELYGDIDWQPVDNRAEIAIPEGEHPDTRLEITFNTFNKKE